MEKTTKKITIYGEINYVLSLVLITLAVAMLASAGYGLSFHPSDPGCAGTV